ncbi:hypothetical protein L5515_002229 [Caenorhabditis briggsae]|uniref:Uncharacterized protein n=1 Tax=Caenorhabditis briggsae TaxID=6238 RepID=A0AAE9E565_CAEBR|nr:hypothetical protein L5515_002229 [Caenorhabditis briggsae]
MTHRLKHHIPLSAHPFCTHNTREGAAIDDLAPRSPRGFTKCRLAGQKLHRPIPRIGYVRMPFYTHWYSFQ